MRTRGTPKKSTRRVASRRAARTGADAGKYLYSPASVSETYRILSISKGDATVVRKVVDGLKIGSAPAKRRS